METITAIYDGKVFVPEGPVDWKAGEVVEVVLPSTEQKERRKALEELLSRARHGGGIDFDRGDLYL